MPDFAVLIWTIEWVGVFATRFHKGGLCKHVSERCHPEDFLGVFLALSYTICLIVMIIAQSPGASRSEYTVGRGSAKSTFLRSLRVANHIPPPRIKSVSVRKLCQDVRLVKAEGGSSTQRGETCLGDVESLLSPSPQTSDSPLNLLISRKIW